MFEHHCLIYLSSIDWDFIWQGHQEIASALAGAGHQVLFVENTGVRMPTLKDWPRLRQRLRNWRRGPGGFRQEQERLFIYSPLLLPFPYSRLACRINEWLLLRALRRWMRALGAGRPVLWTFLPTPLVRRLIRALDPKATVYYCIDDFRSSSRQAGAIRRSEDRLLRDVDLVFVTSEKLRARAAQHNARVHFFPFGVNLARFQRTADLARDVPAGLARLPHPMVGYVGGIHRWVDQALLVQTARRLPEVSFVLIGPPQTDVTALARCPNIHLLGQKPHAELPRYLGAFDAGIIPYRLSEYTDHVYPTKLNECLALGLPVVATDLPEIRRFNAEHGGVVSIAGGPEAFAAAIRRAFASTPEEAAHRIVAARRNSWDARIASMCVLLEEALARRRATAACWDASLRRLYRSARQRLLVPLLTVMAAYLVFLHTPLVWWIAAPLAVRQSPQPADAIVVFAGGVGESGLAGQGYEERVERAVELYRQHYAPRLVFSSGYAYTFKEARVMQALAIALGVPADVILLEDQARNTMENVRNTAALLRTAGCHSALVVSSPYHMRRVALVWRRLAPSVHVTFTPIEHSRFFGDRRTVELKHWRAVVHEYLGLAYYRIRGWI